MSENKLSNSVHNTEMDELVNKIYSNCKVIISEFAEDGAISGFKDIPMIVWWNAISSICALCMRLPEIKDNEKLQEAIVYQTMLRILKNDIPMSDSQRKTVMSIYKKISPTVIDVLIPGKDDCCCFPCF